jgi:DNA-binding CsgD family transcriptional regulator
MGLVAPPESHSETANPVHVALVARAHALATAAEREVLDLLAEGLNQVQVAAQLGLDDVTVRMRVYRLRKKVRAN